MRDTFSRADGGVLVGIERAVRTGRRITGRRARRQKRARNSNHGWTIGSLTVTPVVAIVVAVVVIASAAGAAVALGGRRGARKAAGNATPVSRVAVSAPTSVPKAAPSVKGIYVRYADTAGRSHYMYCTKAAGCGVLDVAKDGTSKIAVASLAGVWHQEQRTVLKHDPCINIIQNAAPIGEPGDFVMVQTTNLRQAGTQVIKGIPAPERIIGDFGVRFEYPVVPNCTFPGSSDSTQQVDSPVTEYVPKRR
jgi:hypothetical protein